MAPKLSEELEAVRKALWCENITPEEAVERLRVLRNRAAALAAAEEEPKSDGRQAE